MDNKNMNDELKNFYNEHSGRKARDFAMSDETSKRVKENIISKLGTVVIESPTPTSLSEKLRRLFLRSYVLIPLVILLFVTGTTYASADALPGDSLYNVKRQVENARLLIAPSEEAKLKLQENFAQKRLNELEQIRTIRSSTGSRNTQSEKGEASNDTIVNIDSDNISSKREKQERKENENNNERSEKAREEAGKALEDLKEAHQNWEHRGENDKAEEIERKVRLFNQQLENRWQNQRSDDNDDNQRRDDSSDSD